MTWGKASRAGTPLTGKQKEVLRFLAPFGMYQEHTLPPSLAMSAISLRRRGMVTTRVLPRQRLYTITESGLAAVGLDQFGGKLG